MLIKILGTLFCPPYDIIQILMIVMIIMFGLYTCEVIIFSFRSCFMNQKIRRFFSAHKPTSGVIIKYDISDGHTYVIPSAVVPGQLVPSVPHFHKTEDQYTVVLECRTDNAHFYAEYQISPGDYKEGKSGETIYIKDSWNPIGFEEI